MLNFLQLFSNKLVEIVFVYCVTPRSFIYLHQFVGITIWYPNFCVILSKFLVGMAYVFGIY